MATVTTRSAATTPDEVPVPLMKWSAVFGGLVLGLALLLLLTALWLALAYGSDLDAVRENLEWYVGISAIGTLFVGGILTGYLSGVRGAGTGMLHGFALWALLILAAIVIGIPSILNVFGLQNVADQAVSGRLIETGDEGALWASFWAILGGFVAAGLGGAIGGMLTRAERRTVVATSTPVAPTTTTMPPADERPVVLEDDESMPTRRV